MFILECYNGFAVTGGLVDHLDNLDTFNEEKAVF